MTITAPTRGPDYVVPSASVGTPIVTAPQPVRAVATESSSTGVPFAADTTAEVARKKNLSPIAGRASPQRYLTATTRAILPLMQDIPAGHIPARLAAQAYQAQRRAESEAAQISAHAAPPTASPSIVQVTEQHASLPTTLAHPISIPPLHSGESATTGGLDVTA